MEVILWDKPKDGLDGQWLGKGRIAVTSFPGDLERTLRVAAHEAAHDITGAEHSETGPTPVEFWAAYDALLEALGLSADFAPWRQAPDFREARRGVDSRAVDEWARAIRAAVRPAADLSWFAGQIFGQPFRETWKVTDEAEFLRLVDEAIADMESRGRRGARAARTLREWLSAEDPRAYRRQHLRDVALALRRLRTPRYSRRLRDLVRLEPLPPPDWVDVWQAASLTDLSKSHIRHLARTGRVASRPHPELGGRIQISVGSLRRYVHTPGRKGRRKKGVWRGDC